MNHRFSDLRIAPLHEEGKLIDDGMRKAVLGALAGDEVARAAYSVSAHIWLEAILTDRALLFVKGAVKPRVIRVPLPVEIARSPSASKKGARLRTPFGVKTLWGSKLDPNASMLCGTPPLSEPQFSEESVKGAGKDASCSRSARVDAARSPNAEVVGLRIIGPDTSPKRRRQRASDDLGRRTWRQRREAKRIAGRRPTKPKRQKARAARVGFAPSSTIWDISFNCVKCGRALTNPNSQRHRVGTDCIKRYGSQARKIENPEFSAWTARKARAEADRATQQVKFDAEYDRLNAAYVVAHDRWKRMRSGGA